MMRYLLYFLCVVFAACGGAGNEPAGPGIPLRSTSCGEPPPTTDSYTLSIRSVDEVEPNDDTSTAYAVDMPVAATPQGLAGIIIEGTINDTTDQEDTFAFTLPESRLILFKLCESDCNTLDYYAKSGDPDSLFVWIAHFSVLDADGNTLDSTVNHNPDENYGQLCIEGGVITYISVRAKDTHHTAQPYRVSAVELGY